jgi:hypothetical protein
LSTRIGWSESTTWIRSSQSNGVSNVVLPYHKCRNVAPTTSRVPFTFVSSLVQYLYCCLVGSGRSLVIENLCSILGSPVPCATFINTYDDGKRQKAAWN